MKLEGKFVSEVMRLIEGRLLAPGAAEYEAERLDSVEEFFASIVLQRDLPKHEPEIVQSIVSLSKNQVVKAETRREKSGFPLEERQKMAALEAALTELIKASRATDNAQGNTYAALVEFAAVADETDALARHRLNIGL